jgi:hypothetical protein
MPDDRRVHRPELLAFEKSRLGPESTQASDQPGHEKIYQ